MKLLDEFYDYQEKKKRKANRDAPFLSRKTAIYIDLYSKELIAKVSGQQIRPSDIDNPNKFLSLKAIAQRGGVDFVQSNLKLIHILEINY